MEFQSSSELYINMKEKDIPKWKGGVSFYDQSKDVIQFWLEEEEKILNGVTIGGYYITPWLYYHINFFKALIATGKAKDNIINPPLDDNFLYVTETYEEARSKDLGMCLFGTRGFSKSTILASNAAWTMTKNINEGIFDIVGGNTKDLDDIYNTFTRSNANIVHPLYLPTLRSNSTKGIDFGVKRKDGEDYTRGVIRITNLEEGKEGASEKAAGGTPCGFICDEIGKFDPRKVLDAAMPAFGDQFGARFVHILAGTGGNNVLSEGAKVILENPASYKLLPINFDRLDRSVPEEALTWRADRGRSFCTFVPAQMSYRLSCQKLTKTLDKFLKVESKELSGIEIKTTNWLEATKEIQKNTDSKENQESKNKAIMYYPTKIDDCFLTDSDNPFPVDRCMKIKSKIETDLEYRLGFFERGIDDQMIEFNLNHKNPVAGRKYENTPIDSPFLVYGEVPKYAVPDNTCVAGLDDYNLAQAKESDSLGSFYVVQRRAVDIDSPIELIRASLATRPKAHNKFHRDMQMAITKYNAKCCMEGVNLGFVDFFENTGEEPENYIAESFSPADEILNKKGKRSKLKSRFGVYPHPANQKYIINLVIKYANEEVEVGKDSRGRKIMKLGVDFIPDPMLLQEMIDYNSKGGNYDRIVAFGHALALCKRLDKMNILPSDVSDELKETNRGEYKVKEKPKFKNFNVVKTGSRKFNNYR